MRYLRSDEQIMDIVHNTFIKLIEKMSLYQFQNHEDMVKWLVTVSKNECLNFIRNHKRRKEILENCHFDILPKEISEEMDIIDKIFLQEFIASLNKKMQKVVDYWLMKGLSNDEINKVTNFSVSKILRIKDEIKGKYKKYRDNLN